MACSIVPITHGPNPGKDEKSRRRFYLENHALIERWRRQQSLALTARLRPELIAQARMQGRLSPQDEEFLATLH